MYECTTCGACCRNSAQNLREGYPWYVEVDDPDSDLLRKVDLRRRHVVEDEAGVPHLRLHPDGRCTALRGRLGQRVSCDVYKSRPRGCRLVQPGDDRCAQARLDAGLPVEPHALRQR
ncbi:MAG TPA: YkgJ family cysteine cluster protein [Myxococcota bacterium]|nr:YkgJ family cysteine cluster protein [Myxococcota bacterium]